MASVHRHRTDTASSHSEGFLRNLHKKVPLENVTRVPCVKYLSPRMNRKQAASCEDEGFKRVKSKMFLLVNVFLQILGGGLLDPPWGCKG